MSNQQAVEFWRRVNALIKSRKTKQQSVAESCGIPYQTFRGWVTRRVYPDASEAVRIARALETSVETLVTGTAPQISPEMPLFGWLTPDRKSAVIKFYNYNVSEQEAESSAASASSTA